MLAFALTVATLSAAVLPAGVVAQSTDGEAPLADAGLDQRVTVGATVTLDATGSRDPDGRLVDYRWAVETPDGRTTVPAPPNRGRTRLTVTQPGRYEVTVTVTDDDGNQASDTLYVLVERPATPTTSPTAGPTRTTTPSSDTPPPRPPTTSEPSPDTSAPAAAPAATPTGPTATVSTAVEAPTARPYAPPGPDCAETLGPTCIDPPACTDPDSAESCDRSLRISGPASLDEGETGTYTAVTDGFGGDVSFRWQAGELSRSVDRSFSPGEHDVVVTATDGEETFLAEKTVYVERNAPPKVSIADPGDVDPGEAIVLSLEELSDPDGSVTTVSWSGGSPVASVRDTDTVRSVRVPTGNGSKRVEVTAVDDDGESATDSIVISSSRSVSKTYKKESGPRTADCTFYDYGSGVSDQPIRCWNKATGELIYDRDPNEGPDDFIGPHSHPGWDVDWYQVARPDDDTIRPGSAMAEDVPVPANQTQEENTNRANTSSPQNETVVSIVNSSEVESGYSTYSKNDKSVATDLTGDGRVDLQDWQERYGDPSAPSVEPDTEKIRDLKSSESYGGSSSSRDTSDGGESISGALKEAFGGLSDTVDSVTGQDSSSEENDNEDSDDSATDVVSDTIDSITEAFSNLGSESDSGQEESSASESSDSAEEESTQTDNSDESCSETTLGFEICF
ncbi:PKD domain-containing protein [Salinirubellus salinus]